MSHVWERANVDKGTLLVLLALADWANDEGVCWPSVPTIAKKSRLGVRQVRRILADLETAKVITIKEKCGRGNTNVYKLNLTICPVFVELNPVTDDLENLTFLTSKPDISDNAIRKEPSVSTTVSEPSWKMPPEDLPAISFAQRVVEELCLGHEPGILHAAAGAINFCVKFESKTKSSATEYLIALAKDEIDRGGAPTRFWFTDRKWRNGNVPGNSKAQRVQDESLDAIRTAVSRINGRTAGQPESSVSRPERDSGNGGVVLDGTRVHPPRGRAATAGNGSDSGNA